MEVSGHFHALPLYYEAKTSHYPLDRRVGENQRQSGFHGEQKHLLPMPERNIESLAIHPVGC
jgi:hypothetical protein